MASDNDLGMLNQSQEIAKIPKMTLATRSPVVGEFIHALLRVLSICQQKTQHVRGHPLLSDAA